ncbi:MAG TPA: GNAT family protein [Vicinamibacterales bacterium]|nr:GNAT family protein [Vicinamibacterales bacterium]
MYQLPSETMIHELPGRVERRTPLTRVPDVSGPEWRDRLPALAGRQVVLRELRISDAPSLLAMLSSEEVSRFMSPAPATVEGYEQFIAWAERQRREGTLVCFAITLKGFDTAIGLFQVRQLDTNFSTAEWGFAVGSPFWGTGVFADGAALVLRFVFDTIGAHRLEARAALKNGRGNGALLKLGAVQEGVLRKGLVRNGQAYDQILYAIVRDDWRASRAAAVNAAAVQVH